MDHQGLKLSQRFKTKDNVEQRTACAVFLAALVASCLRGAFPVERDRKAIRQEKGRRDESGKSAAWVLASGGLAGGLLGDNV